MQKNNVVYTHSINGNIFYVGCGNIKRPHQTISRNKIWNKIVTNNSGLFDVEIVGRYILRVDSLIAESELILKLMPDANITGRKTLYRPNGYKNINIEIPDKLKEEIDKYSRKNGIYLRKIVELALIEYMKKYSK